MLFNTPLFFVFFVVFLLFYGVILLQRKPRTYLILVSSLVFYGAWNYKFVPLLIGSAIADFFIAQRIHASPTRKKKKLFLTLSVAINLGILGLFKYADFAIQSVATLLTALNFDVSWPELKVILPVGISFYTFQSLSYTIDVYRGELEPRRSLVEFTSALAFFPQLVAGPILRAKQILPQFDVLHLPRWDEVKHACLLITVGLMKKTGADLLAHPVAKAFDSDSPVSMLETWTGVLAFAGQIYGDFSGYSDMAIGLALLLGFKIPLNFRLPYIATSPIEFWRRWHISLSTWLRDYLYIPLGGNRNGHYRNILITMLLGGLWHGAAWTFVIWGAFHGLWIMAAHWIRGSGFLSFLNKTKSFIWIGLKWATSFYMVLIGWVFFRATSMDVAWQVLTGMHGFSIQVAPGPLAIFIFGVTVMGVILMHLADACVLLRSEVIEKRGWLFWPGLMVCQALCLLIGEPSSEFIYFQF